MSNDIPIDNCQIVNADSTFSKTTELYAEVLNKLDYHTRIWAANLTSDDLSYILQSVYRIPGLIQSLKNTSIPIKAADIGKQGEQEFARICRALPDNYQIINTAKQGKQGDFVIVYRNNNQSKKCLVDIKKYTTTVPKKELDKFHEDLSYGSYDAGLIISYSTKFTGITDNIFIEEKQLSCGTIPVMYLANIDSELILQCIKVLMLKTISKDNYDIRLSKVETLIACINNTLLQSALTRRMLAEMQQDVCKNVQKCQENLISLEVQMKRNIKEINKIIEDEKIVALKAVIPKIPERSDNIEDIKTQPDKDLDVPSRKKTIIDADTTAETTNLIGNKSETTTLIGNKSETTTLIGNKSETTNLIGNKSETTNLIGNKSETDNLQDTEVIDESILQALERYKQKDRMTIISLIDAVDECHFNDDYMHFSYGTAKKVHIILKPLKTKTSTIICIPRAYIKYIPDVFIERGVFNDSDSVFKNIETTDFSKNSLVYVGSLNSDILTFVKSTIE